MDHMPKLEAGQMFYPVKHREHLVAIGEREVVSSVRAYSADGARAVMENLGFKVIEVGQGFTE